MPIQPSAASDVTRLLAELRSDDTLRRETAVARLAVIGPRAVSGLLALAADRGLAADSRIAALRALESLADPRATPLVLTLVEDRDDELAGAAVGVLGTIAKGSGPRATAAFDRLTALALDRTAGVERRLAALAALDGFPDRILKPLRETLARDPASRVVARVVRQTSGVLAPLGDLVD